MMISQVCRVSSRVARKRLLTSPQCLVNNSQGCISLFHTSPSMRQAAEQAAPARRKKHELSDESKEKIERIFQKILYLDAIEVHLVTELVNQKMGLLLTPQERVALQKVVDGQKVGGGGGASADAGAEVKEEGPKTVDIKLAGFDAKSKIKVIKEVRAICNLGLKEAKELVESAPKVIQKDLKPEQAEELKKKLEEVGAQIELV